jgi:Tfp pilus assembly protein PilO
MKQRLLAFLERLRGAGVLGLGVLCACIAFYFSAVAPTQQRLAALRMAQEQVRAAPGASPSAADRALELDRFYAQFPPLPELGEQLERIHRLARASGVDLTKGEYRLERANVGLWPYRMTLPVRGSYAQMRDFVAAVLKEMPAVSVDALRFERKKASETRLEAQLRFTLYLRPNGDTS